MSFSLTVPKPPKGRFSKKPNRRALQRYRLEAGGEYKTALNRESGMHRSSGAASEGASLDPSSPEFAAIAARHLGDAT